MLRAFLLVFLMAIANYFVDPANGSDATGLGTLAAPWKSTAHALTTLTRNLNGGDRINIKQGAPDVLTAALNAALATYGASSLFSQLLFQGYAAALGDGGIGEINGNGLYSIVSSQPGLLTFRNLKLGNCGVNGYVLALNNSCLVENCEVYGITRSDSTGISGQGGTIARNCYVHDCGNRLVSCPTIVGCLLDIGASTTLHAAAEATITAARNRIFVAQGANGINADTNALIDRNSIYCRSGGTGAGVLGMTGNTESRVTNNVIEGFNGVGGAGIADFSNHTIGALESNRVFNCTTPYSLPNPVYFDDGNNLTLTASPFTNPAAGDLSLNDNPAGGGLCRAASYPSGFQGGPRTQWADCGAIQHSDPTSPPTPTLSITNLGNGTGATATILGSAGGCTNTVYAVPALNPTGIVVPIASVSRTGDGTVSLSLPTGWYAAYVESSLNGLYAATGDEYSFSVSGGSLTADYGRVLAAVLSVLKANATLTGSSGLLAAFDPNGVSPSRSNSIFYQRPPTAQPPTPCIVLADLEIDPAAPIAEEPTHYAMVPLMIYVYGSSDLVRQITWYVDEALRTAHWGGAMDTADWQIKQIDSGQTTRRGWMTVPSNEQLTDSNGVNVEQRAKSFVIKAASTHN